MIISFSIYPKASYLLYLGSVPTINLSWCALSIPRGSLQQTSSLSVAVLLSLRPTDSDGDHIPRICSNAWGRSFPLPSSLFGLETSRCLYTYITSFCTWHVAVLNNVHACGCMFPHRPSDSEWGSYSRVCSNTWG